MPLIGCPAGIVVKKAERCALGLAGCPADCRADCVAFTTVKVGLGAEVGRPGIAAEALWPVGIVSSPSGSTHFAHIPRHALLRNEDDRNLAFIRWPGIDG